MKRDYQKIFFKYLANVKNQTSHLSEYLFNNSNQ